MDQIKSSCCDDSIFSLYGVSKQSKRWFV